MAHAQQKSIHDRIDPELKLIIEQAKQSLEIDADRLLHDPESIQDERAEYIMKKPVAIPPNIRVLDFVTASSVDGSDIRLRCYQPLIHEPRRVILYFHGGGYVFGQPEQVEQHMFWLADQLKTTIISVDYRLAPQHPFPIPIKDGFDALQWTIHTGANKLGIIPDAITVYGASAGGHLAAAVSQMAVDNGIHNIKHQFLLYPVIHNRLNTESMLEFTDTPLWNQQLASIAWTHFLGKENVTKSIPYADLSIFEQFDALPQTTIVACELDPLRDEDMAYAQQLYQAGVKTELWVIPGAVHVFDMFPSTLTDDFHKFLLQNIFP